MSPIIIIFMGCSCAAISGPGVVRVATNSAATFGPNLGNVLDNLPLMNGRMRPGAA